VSAGARAGQRAARLLRGGMSAGRAMLPMRSGPIATILRPVSARVHRTIRALEGAELRELEAELRQRIAVAPENAQLRFDLGLCLAGQGRNDDAIEAWFTAAELGLVEWVVLTLHTRPPFPQLVGTDAHIRRMSALAAARPDSAETQLAVGAFLLDHGHLEEGRRTVRRGYELELGGKAVALADRPLLPSFLVLGPHKAGTSTLYALLLQHPRVVGAARKEVQFWEKRDGRPPELYDAYFPPIDPDAGFITGEATPHYLFSPEAAAAAAQRLPGIKTIVLRRDPVARAYSHFQMMRRLQDEPRGFDEAIERELSLLGGVPPLQLADVPDVHAPYLLGSCILPFLGMWIESIGAPRVMVVDSAHLATNRQATLDALHAYLGLEPAPLVDDGDRNVADYPALPARTEARLRDWFEPHEAALDRLLAGHPARIGGAASFESPS
jgi:tetratricopeptide (TPR) repeat protein